VDREINERAVISTGAQRQEQPHVGGGAAKPQTVGVWRCLGRTWAFFCCPVCARISEEKKRETSWTIYFWDERVYKATLYGSVYFYSVNTPLARLFYTFDNVPPPGDLKSHRSVSMRLHSAQSVGISRFLYYRRLLLITSTCSQIIL